MKKMFVIFGLIVLVMFVVSCAPTGEAFYRPKASSDKKLIASKQPKVCVGGPTGKYKCVNKVVLTQKIYEKVYDQWNVWNAWAAYAQEEWISKECIVYYTKPVLCSAIPISISPGSSMVHPASVNVMENEETQDCDMTVGCK